MHEENFDQTHKVESEPDRERETQREIQERWDRFIGYFVEHPEIFESDYILAPGRSGVDEANYIKEIFHVLEKKCPPIEPHATVGTHYLAPEKAAQIISMMMEGMSLRAISRLTGHDLKTILSLLETAGESCRKLWDAYVTGIRTQFVQADEIWTYCGAHARRLRPDAPVEWGDVYVWIALDSLTKMVISYHVGRRGKESGNEFVRDLSKRVEGRFQLTTDGLRWYVPAVEEHFGADIDFAQLIKLFGSHDVPGPEWYSAARGLWERSQASKPDIPIRVTSLLAILNAPTLV